MEKAKNLKWQERLQRAALTKRLELLLRTVLAFPNASRRGLDCRMMSFTCCRHNTETALGWFTLRKRSGVWTHFLYLDFRSSSGYFRNVAHNIFGSHCLSSAALSTVSKTRKRNKKNEETRGNMFCIKKQLRLTWWWHTDSPLQSSCSCTCCPSAHRCEADSHTGPADAERETDSHS